MLYTKPRVVSDKYIPRLVKENIIPNRVLLEIIRTQLKNHEVLYNSRTILPYNLSLYELIGLFCVYKVLSNHIEYDRMKIGVPILRGSLEINDGYINIDGNAYILEQVSAFIKNKKDIQHFDVTLQERVTEALIQKTSKGKEYVRNKHLVIFTDANAEEIQLSELLNEVVLESNFVSVWLIGVKVKKNHVKFIVQHHYDEPQGHFIFKILKRIKKIKQ